MKHTFHVSPVVPFDFEPWEARKGMRRLWRD